MMFPRIKCTWERLQRKHSRQKCRVKI